jgi:mRNA interferase HigB
MRVISKKKMKSFWSRHSSAKKVLGKWYEIVTAANWTSLTDIRNTYPHADEVKTDKGSRVIVFNVGGNKFRIISAIHYRSGIIFILDVLTHAEYNRARWKRRF